MIVYHVYTIISPFGKPTAKTILYTQNRKLAYDTYHNVRYKSLNGDQCQLDEMKLDITEEGAEFWKTQAKIRTNLIQELERQLLNNNITPCTYPKTSTVKMKIDPRQTKLLDKIFCKEEGK